jgi:hypothetical protein
MPTDSLAWGDNFTIHNPNAGEGGRKETEIRSIWSWNMIELVYGLWMCQLQRFQLWQMLFCFWTVPRLYYFWQQILQNTGSWFTFDSLKDEQTWQRSFTNSDLPIKCNDNFYKKNILLHKSCKRVYPKVSRLATWSKNCKRYSSLPLGAVVPLFCESV